MSNVMQEPQRSHGHTVRRLVFFFGALGGLLWGYDTGVIGSALLFIKNDLELGSFAQGLVVSGLAMGAVVGSAISGRIADRVGRRRLIMVAAVIFGIGSLGGALAISATMLVVFRIGMGLGIGISSVVVPLYLAEMAPSQKRGALSSLNQLMITVGILVAYVVDYSLASRQAWRWMIGVAILPSVVLIAGMFFMPETPRWLAKRGRIDEARRALVRVRGTIDVESELDDVRSVEHAEEQTEKRSILRERWVRPTLVVAIGLAVLQQLLGINTIIYYAPTTLSKVGFGDSAAILANVGIGAVNVAITVAAIRLIDRVGRKPLLLGGLVGMVVSLGVLAVLSLLTHGSGGTMVGIVTLLCLVTFILSFGISWGPVVWVMLPEVLPLGVRGTAMGVANLLHWLANILVALTFPVLLEAMGMGPLFLIFAGIGICSFWFVAAKVTETKGRSLEQIEVSLRTRYHGSKHGSY